MDAVDVGRTPGTLVRLEGDEIPLFLKVKMSSHQNGINVVLWDIQPANVRIGFEQSDAVETQVKVVFQKIIGQRDIWVKWGNCVFEPLKKLNGEMIHLDNTR